MALIEVEKLSKDFSILKRDPGLKGAIWSLVRRRYETVHAVSDVSFEIQRGELVGYIGPNGAGKSTTIKMLTGILIPTSGHLRVCDFVPYRERRHYTRNIGVVFGQRTQLWWDIPVIESFNLLQKVYKVSDNDYRRRLDEFKELLNLDEILDVPVRKLSLGQRMRCDLVASMLHNPQVLFLDEPSIGLDVVGKLRIREFLQRINRETGVTMILTTHDLREIEELCNRLIIVDHGRILYDGGIGGLRTKYAFDRHIIFQLSESHPSDGWQNDLDFNGSVRWETPDPLKVKASFRKESVNPAAVISSVMKHLSVHDITIEEPEIEQIIGMIYSQGKVKQ